MARPAEAISHADVVEGIIICGAGMGNWIAAMKVRRHRGAATERSVAFVAAERVASRGHSWTSFVGSVPTATPSGGDVRPKGAQLAAVGSAADRDGTRQ